VGAVELPGTFGITCEHGIFAGLQNAKRCLPTTQPLGNEWMRMHDMDAIFDKEQARPLSVLGSPDYLVFCAAISQAQKSHPAWLIYVGGFRTRIKSSREVFS